MRMKRKCGFSLLEIIFVIAIISIISVMAVPIYQHHILQARRLVAVRYLVATTVALEKYHLENGSYDGATLQNLKLPSLINNNYALSLTIARDDNYQVIAKPLAMQQKDQHCGQLVIDSNGRKNISGDGSIADCWL
jgi:type IV pilus assembly protein PilE